MKYGTIIFSKKSDEWNTPKALFKLLDAEFNFDSDPCPSSEPLKPNLLNGWGRRVFLNPPYSGIKTWMLHAFDHNLKGNLVVCLVPSRTDTQWWHDYAMHANEIRFIKGRLRFSNAKNNAPFPSAILIHQPPL